MTKDEGNPNDEARRKAKTAVHPFVIRVLSLIRHSTFGFRHLMLDAAHLAAAAEPLLVSRGHLWCGLAHLNLRGHLLKTRCQVFDLLFLLREPGLKAPLLLRNG